jgi:hypothetical protein
MKTRALAVLLPVLALAGCMEDNNVSIQVYALCLPPDDQCVFSDTCDAQFIGENVLDLSVSNSFWSFVEVHNNTQANDDTSAGRPNTRDAYVEEYSVEYDVNGGTAPPAVRRRVPSGPSIVPVEGTSVISVLPVPEDVGAVLGAATQVVARVRLRGFLADQSTWETAEFPIPIRICTGCLGVPTCSDPAQFPVPCPQFGQSPATFSCQ